MCATVFSVISKHKHVNAHPKVLVKYAQLARTGIYCAVSPTLCADNNVYSSHTSFYVATRASEPVHGRKLEDAEQPLLRDLHNAPRRGHQALHEANSEGGGDELERRLRAAEEVLQKPAPRRDLVHQPAAAANPRPAVRPGAENRADGHAIAV